jgi:hypothetical protein
MSSKQTYHAPAIVSLGAISALTRASQIGPYCDQITGTLSTPMAKIDPASCNMT